MLMEMEALRCKLKEKLEILEVFLELLVIITKVAPLHILKISLVVD
jgi:hypothetical protein